MMNLMREKVSQFIIYALHNYDSKYVYVGKSSSGLQRPREHMQTANLVKYAHTPRVKWIKSLRARDCEPEIVVLEDLSTRDALNEAEQFHIAYFRSIGVPLLNCTDGGDGGIGYQLTDEQIAKVAAASKARAAAAGGREFLSEISKNYWANAEAREKKSIQQTGKTHSPETCAKLSADRIGIKKTPEECANMSTAAKIRWSDPQYVEKQREVQKAVKGSEEARAQASKAATEQWANPESRARKSEEVKKKWENPAYRARMLEAFSRRKSRRNKKQDDK